MSKKQQTLEKSRKKRKAFDENHQPPRKTESKPSTRSTITEFDEQNNKITNYFEISLSTSINRKNYKVNPIDPDKKTIEELEQRIRQKEKQILYEKDRRQEEQAKINQINFETRKQKTKNRQVLCSTLLSIAEIKRNQRKKKDPRLGQFGDRMRTFTQGQKILNIRKEIENKQSLIKKLQQRQKSSKKRKQPEQHTRILGSIDFHRSELQDLLKEKEYIEKQVAVYKDRLKLADKQYNSYYSKNNWPIVYDRYQTLQLLGSGGFGQVYKCFDLEDHKDVALKRIYMTTYRNLSEKEQFFKHVKRQAQIQTQLDHPNIAKLQKIVEVDEQKKLVVFQLQYCSGPQLGTILRKSGCIEQSKAKIYMKQLFSVLHYLSEQKERIIHYDLKPSNIMFHEGILKILDFGLSKIMHDQDTKMQLTSQGVGTYWYLPPQTFQEYFPKISPKVDVWSLGVIFFQLLYGRKPFGHGIPQSQVYNRQLILKAYKVDFPKQTPRGYKVSESAKQFIRKCLTYDQNERLSPTQAYHHQYFNK